MGFPFTIGMGGSIERNPRLHVGEFITQNHDERRPDVKADSFHKDWLAGFADNHDIHFVHLISPLESEMSAPLSPDASPKSNACQAIGGHGGSGS